MIKKTKFIAVVLTIIALGLSGIGYAGSEIPYVFKYSFSTNSKNY